VIQNEVLKIISSGTDDYRCGDEIRPVLIGKVGEASKKKEPGLLKLVGL